MNTEVHIATSKEEDTTNTNAEVQIVKAKRRTIRPTYLRDYV